MERKEEKFMELNKFRKEMADTFIAALKEDRIPWHRDWTSIGQPINAITEQPYHGNNAFWLSYTAMEKKYNDPRWCTFKQAGDNGWQIKKGEKGTRVEFFSFYDKLLKKNITSIEAEKIRIQNLDEYKARIRLVSQTYIVFNGSQIIGMPEYIPEGDRNILNEYELITCRDMLIKNMGVSFNEGGDRAYYSPAMDAIHMPKISSFETDYGYMSTFLHEAAHATGAKTRLDRDLTGSFGSKEYAVEELRAEIASAFTAQLTGIPYEQSEFMENHKAYVQNWISVLENNPNELFRAIKDAEEISDYLIEKGELLVAQEKAINNRYTEITKEKKKRETEDALIEGVEFAIDNGLSVSREDWDTYKKIIENRKSQHSQNNKQNRGRSR